MRVLWTVGADAGEVGVREVGVEDCECCMADMQDKGLDGSQCDGVGRGEEWEGERKGDRLVGSRCSCRCRIRDDGLG